MPEHKTIDGYINTFPQSMQVLLQKVRHTIKQVIPNAEETISYQIPAFKLASKYVIYFAGWKNHISLYPIPTGTTAFIKKITPYVAGKGTLKFPLDKPIPYDVIEEVVKVKLKQIS
jgi:uncharacterized protein YdhG (YjbR/CyaY superfamily)